MLGFSYWGSPPRVRELHVGGGELNSKAGITPACAGITSHLLQSIIPYKDHPRVCGNYRHHHPPAAFFQGSPPRVRELLSGQYPASRLPGITPACAGITNIFSRASRLSWDHPRVCGNYPPTLSKLSAPAGSPPRVRELPQWPLPGSVVSWITPACAGITRTSWGSASPARDHPRVCGNYSFSSGTPCKSSGSPPRVRELRGTYREMD